MAKVALPSHLNPTARRWACRTALGAAAMTTCLQAGAASALSFNFSFTSNDPNNTPNNPATVTGIVEGLVDNTDNQLTGLTVTITSATNTPPGGWPVFTDADLAPGLTGVGFDVSNGQITGVTIKYKKGGAFAPQSNADYNLILANQGFWQSELYDRNYNFDNNAPNGTANSIVFSPYAPASVPGPLPLLGAGAAFGWSRRLRRRIKVSA